jgi:hypothetical protein
MWWAYWAGALLTLFYKFTRYLYLGTKNGGRGWKAVSLEWLFDPSADNTVSWGMTIGVVWIGGYLFIHRTDLLLGYLGLESESVTLHYSVAFLWGSICERFGPDIAKWAVSWVRAKLPS